MSLINITFNRYIWYVFRKVTIHSSYNPYHVLFLTFLYFLVNVDPHYHGRLVSEWHVTDTPRCSSYFGTDLCQDLVTNTSQSFTILYSTLQYYLHWNSFLIVTESLYIRIKWSILLASTQYTYCDVEWWIHLVQMTSPRIDIIRFYCLSDRRVAIIVELTDTLFDYVHKLVEYILFSLIIKYTPFIEHFLIQHASLRLSIKPSIIFQLYIFTATHHHASRVQSIPFHFDRHFFDLYFVIFHDIIRFRLIIHLFNQLFDLLVFSTSS